MPTPVTINGVTYQQPDQGTPKPWGDVQATIIAALASTTLQKNGGAFTLTADANFGATFGLVSNYFKSRSSNTAAAGAVRLARTDTISYRNQANDGDLPLGVNASNQLEFAGSVLAVGTGDVAGPGGATDNAVAVFDGTTGKTIKNSVGILDGSGNLSGIASINTITDTEISYLDNVTSNIQNQLNDKISGVGTVVGDTITLFSGTSGGIVKSANITPQQLAKYAVQGKADFYSYSDNEIIIPIQRQALINGVMYTTAGNIFCNITTSGRGGLDTGSVAAGLYALYAIPPTSGTSFDLICSLADPTTAGPTGFANWSYLGSFQVWDDAGTKKITPFNFVNRTYQAIGRYVKEHYYDTNESPQWRTFNTETPVNRAIAVSCILTAHEDPATIAYVNNSATLNGIPLIASSSSTLDAYNSLSYLSVVNSNPQTLFIYKTNSLGACTARIFGWTEQNNIFN
jgi:hypothetical protein